MIANNDNTKMFMFTGAIIGGVLGAIALIHSMVYIPLKSDITSLDIDMDKRYDAQIQVNVSMISSLARIESKLGIDKIK